MSWQTSRVSPSQISLSRRLPAMFEHQTVPPRNTVTAHVPSTPPEQRKRHPRQRLLPRRRFATGDRPQKIISRTDPQHNFCAGDSLRRGYALPAMPLQAARVLIPYWLTGTVGRDALAIMAVSYCSSTLHRENAETTMHLTPSSPPLTGPLSRSRLTENHWPPLTRPLAGNKARRSRRIGLFRVLNTLSFRWWRRPLIHHHISPSQRHVRADVGTVIRIARRFIFYQQFRAN